MTERLEAVMAPALWMQGISKRFNIGTGRPVSFNELAYIVTRAAGYHPELRHEHDAPTGVRYRVLALADSEMDRLRTAIAHTAARRDELNQAMEQHYAAAASGRFPEWAELEAVDRLLSDLDNRFSRACGASN